MATNTAYRMRVSFTIHPRVAHSRLDFTMPNPTSPAEQDFVSLAEHHTLIPVHRTLIADLETPVSAFLRLAGAHAEPGEDQPEAFLLESVEGGERVGRYTFIGIEPYQRFVANGRSITHTTLTGTRTFEGDIFAELKHELSAHTPARLPGLPPFTAGAVASLPMTSSARLRLCQPSPRMN